jgi:hypothetical protein
MLVPGCKTTESVVVRKQKDAGLIMKKNPAPFLRHLFLSVSRLISLAGANNGARIAVCR